MQLFPMQTQKPSVSLIRAKSYEQEALKECLGRRADLRSIDFNLFPPSNAAP